jgi:hypothetical protein
LLKVKVIKVRGVAQWESICSRCMKCPGSIYSTSKCSGYSAFDNHNIEPLYETMTKCGFLNLWQHHKMSTLHFHFIIVSPIRGSELNHSRVIFPSSLPCVIRPIFIIISCRILTITTLQRNLWLQKSATKSTYKNQ